MNMFGLVLLQQFLYIDEERARGAISGMFFACLVIILLSNISFVGLNIKHGRSTKRHNEKVLKVERYISKRKARKSIARYAMIAKSQNLAVTIMGIKLNTLPVLTQ